MKIHLIAQQFPPMSDDEIAALANDIEQRGLLNPGVTYKGQLLDGRNREKACAIAKRKFTTTEYRGSDPLGFVVAQNNIRRHLTLEQRTVIAMRLGNLKWGQTKKASREAPQDASAEAHTQREAADKLGVSRRSVQRRQAIEESAIDEIKELVDAGEITLSTGAELATMNKTHQHAAVKGGATGAAKASKDHKAAKKKADAGFDPDEFVGNAGQWCDAADRLLAHARRLPTNGRLRKAPATYTRERLRSSRTLISEALERLGK